MAKAKDKKAAEPAAASNGNGAAGNPDTGQLLDQDTLDDLATLDNDPGGPPPSKSILKLSSYKKDIGNQFKEGEEVVFQAHARCEFVGFGGGKRIQEFNVIDIFQDEELDADLVERFKDHLEGYVADAKTKALITAFLDSCVAEPEAAAEPAAEAPAPAEPPTNEGDGGELDLSADGSESVIDGEEEVVDGVVVEEEDTETAAMEEAAGDLDWSGESGA
jgi:hypothetical protein